MYVYWTTITAKSAIHNNGEKRECMRGSEVLIFAVEREREREREREKPKID